MYFKHSLKQVLRTPARTSLFVILLAAITALLAIGISMHLSAVQSIAATDKAFTTIGTVSFENLNNPDLTLPEIMNYDYSPILKSKHVQLLDRRIMLAGVAKEVTAAYDSPGALIRDGVRHSIIEFTPINYSVDGETTLVRILNVHYSYKGSWQPGQVIHLDQWASSEYWEPIKLEPGKNYVTCGYEYNVRISVYPWFAKGRLFGAGILKEDDTFPSIVETTEYFWDEEGQLWGRLAEILRTSVQTLSVYTTNDLATMRIFNQGNAIISKGRSITETEYEEGAKVCVISNANAWRNGFQVGDRISLAFSERPLIFSPLGAMVDHGSAEGWDNYEIIGFYTIIDNMGETYGLYEDTVFVPQKSVAIQPDNITIAGTGNTGSYTASGSNSSDLVTTDVYLPGWDNFVSFRLNNGSVDAFKREMEQYDLSGLSLAYYDQGYSKVSAALTGMRDTASILTAICSAVGLGIALLFSLLFVGRQQQSIAIMYSLGTGRKRALAFLMVSVLLVSGLAVCIGGVAGYFLSDFILAETYAGNIEAMAVDSSFSSISGGDTEVGFQVAAPPGHQAPLAAAGSVLAVTLALSGFFAARVLRAEPMQVLTTKEE